MQQERKMNILRIAAIIITLGLLFVGFYYNKTHSVPMRPVPVDNAATGQAGVINDVIFACDNNQAIHAVFLDDNTVSIDLSDGRSMTLPHALSADGARYANTDESFVFWNKGDTAFVTENGSQTYANCVLYAPTQGK